jgi:hypothetical protein
MIKHSHFYPNTSASNVNYPSVDEQLVERSSELKVLASRAAFLQIHAGLGGFASHRVRTDEQQFQTAKSRRQQQEIGQVSRWKLEANVC